MDQKLIVTDRLSKSYGGLFALRDLSLSLDSGRIIGLLGPNGSGKTTLIKILAGLLTPTAGRALIDGSEPGERTKSLVSYLPERPYFNSYMTVSECLSFFEDFYADFDRLQAERMLLSLGVPVDAKLKHLSKGTKEKVQLVLVMSRRARLYLLDEPIAGVDPAARDYILKTIISSRNPDSSVLISTHLIADVESFLDEFLLINRGQLMLSGDVKRLHAERNMSLDHYFREVFACSANY
ncbi:MAG: ABC transporter ATP-binding protein [Ruminococcaceae bacterium]|nr:ABC transporter ATP-binding protein [Oscillospiraceae bacterium]